MNGAEPERVSGSGAHVHADIPQTHAAEARLDWERRIGDRLAGAVATAPQDLPAPAQLTAEPGSGHIRLDWAAVQGAAGYVIERSSENGAEPRDSEPEILRHGGSDVPAVVGPPFSDTGVTDGQTYRYRVAAIASPEVPPGPWSEPATAHPTITPAGPVEIVVDVTAVKGQLARVWEMVGAERLSQLRVAETWPPRAQTALRTQIGDEFADALRLAHADLGATTVRAHAILHDDNAVVTRRADGGLRFDFGAVDAIYDQVLGFGLRPVVELSFMPAALARDPQQTVFTYRGIISPPADWAEWRQLVGELAAHLVHRYGAIEVAQWAFEVWNEPNLAVFWPAGQQEYLRLYDEAARAIKAVDPRLRVGGPASAAAEWIELLAAHATAEDVPLDFVSTHTYGNQPIDARPALARHGYDGIPVWWTEWGVGSTHFGAVHDSVLGAPFMLSGFLSAQGRVDRVAYWVISDHFEELGRPQRLFHNGFGLLTVGNLRKPRYWAAHLAAHQGDDVLRAELAGDGADTLVQAWATRHDDGTIDVLVWNGTINADLLAGDLRLDRDVRLTVTGMQAATYQPALARVDAQHSNVVTQCPADVTWPDDQLWARLRASDALYEEQLPAISPDDGTACFGFRLPMPGIARIRLTAGGGSSARH
jgi:xylan 1,4-beta-xylosidase